MMNDLIFNPIKYEERFFWSLKEVLGYGGSHLPTYLVNIETFEENLDQMIGTTQYTTPIWDSENQKIKTQYRGVVDLVMKRYAEHIALVTKVESLTTEEIYNFIAKFVYILEMTSPRYLKLLEVYESAKDELLSPVEIQTGGITRFNDTPQDEGDFANDSHTTNLTEDSRSTKNDLDTKMGRIREIEGNYNNLLIKWSNEFESLFIEEANV